jgi:hypothetical protein
MSPPLEDIQRAINECAKKVLSASKVREAGIHTTHSSFAISRVLTQALLLPTFCGDPVSNDVPAIAGCSQGLPCWGQEEVSHFNELISSDKEIVKSILRLTGSVEGIKQQVRVEYSIH